jgi:hypothetical protein
MTNLLSPRWMIVKAALFVVIALLSAAVLVSQTPTWTTVACVAALAWAASRAYYFAFYVVERYVDPSYRFAGLGSAIAWIWRRRRARSGRDGAPPTGHGAA